MPDQARKKDYFTFNKGLNTESNEINFPDGYSTDERNYELLVDGSRRRRKGLALESGGSAKTVATITSTQVHNSFNWRGAAGNPSNNFFVHQVGAILYFTNDAEIISTTYSAETINLEQFEVAVATTAAQIANLPCQFAFGRGKLFVTHSLLEPFYVDYEPVGATFDTTRIQLKVRDFDGIDDGVGVDFEPTGTITDDHRYNLRNRGWKQADMDTYFSDLTKHPAKNALWYRGYVRALTASTSYNIDGVQSWSSTKLDAEQFGNASAAQGSLLLNPLDTTASVDVAGGGTTVPIVATGFQSGSGTAGGTIRLTVTGHGRVVDDMFTISGHDWTYLFGILNLGHFSLDGGYTVNNPSSTPNAVGEADVVDANTIDVYFPPIAPDFLSLVDQTQDGQIDGGAAVVKSDGKALTVGPSAVAFQAGRVWYAGIQDSEWADTIFFSRIAQKPTAYGRCFQEQDPTDSQFNQLTPADGGTIVIPNLGTVQRMLPLRDAVLVFTDQGVWEISGGRRGFFTSDGYSVRKITEAECSSPFSPVRLDNGAIFSGPKGIFRLSPNQFTGLLEAESVSDQLIQTLWNAIPAANQQVVQSAYDDALKRVYFLYGDTGDNINQYANALVLDIRVGAWYKYVFNVSSTDGVLTAYAITDADSSDANQKIKWACQTTATVITTCDLNQTAYLDFDGAESPLPYVTTGWDNIGDFQRRKQAPVVTVYAKRTETGYTSTGNGFDPVNESSNLLTAYWDWTDDAVSGKIGSQNETYRHVRAFSPSGTGDVDGYPVVVTRNKVRGRGRVLQLRFDGAATKDSHILGFTMNYKVNRNI